MELKTIRVQIPEGANIILGQETDQNVRVDTDHEARRRGGLERGSRGLDRS